MSDKPLFEDIDEQEVRYAPEELPPDNPQARQARIDEGATANIADAERPAEGAVVTGAAAGTATVGAASGTMGSTEVQVAFQPLAPSQLEKPSQGIPV